MDENTVDKFFPSLDEKKKNNETLYGYKFYNNITVTVKSILYSLDRKLIFVAVQGIEQVPLCEDICRVKGTGIYLPKLFFK